MTTNVMTTNTIDSSDVAVPDSPTSVYDAIYNRRTTHDMTDREVPREIIERLLDTAIWAPNHRLTNPWRFFVLGKGSAARERVSELAWQTAYDKVANPNPEQKQRSADDSKRRVLDAPALIYAYSVPGGDDETTQENYASVCCAVQNMALAAVAEGLVVDWSTGSVTKHPQLAETFGAGEDWEMVGALFIGEPANEPASRRSATQSITSWLD